jgi:hypothetical protein
MLLSIALPMAALSTKSCRPKDITSDRLRGSGSRFWVDLTDDLGPASGPNGVVECQDEDSNIVGCR